MSPLFHRLSVTNVCMLVICLFICTVIIVVVTDTSLLPILLLGHVHTYVDTRLCKYHVF